MVSVNRDVVTIEDKIALQRDVDCLVLEIRERQFMMMWMATRIDAEDSLAAVLHMRRLGKGDEIKILIFTAELHKECGRIDAVRPGETNLGSVRLKTAIKAHFKAAQVVLDVMS